MCSSQAFKFIKPFIATLLIMSSGSHSIQTYAREIPAGQSVSDSVYKEPNCSPAKKIAFSKTFKCGSTTIANMLDKYERNTNLTRVHAQFLEMVKNDPSNPGTLRVDPAFKGDLFFEHHNWNRKRIEALLGPEMRVFTILRDPIDRFESSYSYFNWTHRYGMNIHQFVEDLRHKNISEVRRAPGNDVWGILYGRCLSNALGLPPSSLNNDEEIDNFIRQLDSEMDLVLMKENIEESIVLLRHLLCWELDNTVVFDARVRPPQERVQLEENDRKELKRWFKADYKVYNHFKQVFDEKVSLYPGNMKKEIKMRMEAKAKLREQCKRNMTDDCAHSDFLQATE